MTDIKIELEFKGEGTKEKTLSSLQEWIRQSQIIGLKSIERPIGQSLSGAMGIGVRPRYV